MRKTKKILLFSNPELFRVFSSNYHFKRKPGFSRESKYIINKVYNNSFYGSVLWDLYGKEASKIYNTWNVSIRKMSRFDRKTHRYFIEPVSEMKHLKTSLLKRSIKFKKSSLTPENMLQEMFSILLQMTARA